MKRVLVYYRGAIIPCWETERRYYPVVWHPNGPPTFQFITDEEMAIRNREFLGEVTRELMRRSMEQIATRMEAKFWGPF